MRVHFDVHGANGQELEAAAQRELAKFTNDEPHYVTITAYPEQSAQDGTVIVWRGEVEAQV